MVEDFILNMLKNKVALVTGAGRGFGRPIAMSLAKEGAKVIGVARTRSELNDVAEVINSDGGHITTIQTDLTKEDQINCMVDEVLETFGKLDILYNNAATNRARATIDKVTILEWDQTITLNLRTPFLLTKKFLNSMKKQKSGSIINISSRSAELGFIAETAYCPSKYGIEGLTQCLAMELKPHNIAVNSLRVSAPEGKSLKPGGITLEQLGKMPNEIKKKWADDESMVEAFKDTWVFLALQNASNVTGQRFVTHELAEYLRKNGREAAIANWSGKLTKAVYVTYDMPSSVMYRTKDENLLEFIFK